MANHFSYPTNYAGGPSAIRRINGTKPGVLDPSQPSRLLRLPGSKLSFASFDPLTAYSQETPDITKLNLNTELYRPKRVVIETAPSGECTWRFVPSAKREEGVVDEGTWPRIVDLCGELVELSQDQWDIYKLDQFYDCLVKSPSQHTTIRICSQTRHSSPQPSGKRQRNTLSLSPSPRRTMPPPGTFSEKKGAFVETDSESDDNEEVEVESMIINDDPPRYRPAKPFKDRLNKDRQERREGMNERMNHFFINDILTHNIHPNEPTFSPPKTPERESPPEHGKRKAMEVLDTTWSPDAREMEELRQRSGNYYTATNNGKRTRNVSPLLVQRELERKKLERLKRKQQRMATEAAARRKERERREMSEILKMVPPMNGTPLHREKSDQYMADEEMPEEDGTADTKLTEEEAAHLAELEESRRKLAELERDRPLWEEEAQKRRLREEAEQQALKRKHDERKLEAEKKRAEAEQRARLQRSQEEKKKKEHEKEVRRERELREQERKKKQKAWAQGKWTWQRALERYKVLSEAFDTTKFVPELPLTVDDIPWPVLIAPAKITLNNVTWMEVEVFFKTVQPHVRRQDYKKMLVISQCRFHPDRWRSRNLLKTIEDETLRDTIETTANTVAQALGTLRNECGD